MGVREAGCYKFLGTRLIRNVLTVRYVETLLKYALTFWSFLGANYEFITRYPEVPGAADVPA